MLGKSLWITGTRNVIRLRIRARETLRPGDDRKMRNWATMNLHEAA